MDQVTHIRRDLSLRKSLILYITAFAALAIALSAATAAACDSASSGIRAKYPPVGEQYYLTNERGERLGEGVYIGKDPPVMSERDERAIAFLELLPMVATPVYSALCIIAGALVFYRNKLKKPLAQLRTASEKISKNDLDFSLQAGSGDELGELVRSFEKMRATLAGNFAAMWRQVEERGRLNAAFAHDLRTPLTVLKGYAELLQTADDPQTRETAATMGKHIARLEGYVASMSRLRRLEDAQPEYGSVPLPSLLSALGESAGIVCEQHGKTFRLENTVTAPQMALDPEFVSQVCDNLVSNAVRYAETSVTLSFSSPADGLLLSVSDDGRGFDRDTFIRAADPYFTRESDRSQHFGLGLYLCKLLCEHHGGYLEIEDVPAGAKVSAFFKTPAM